MQAIRYQCRGVNLALWSRNSASMNFSAPKAVFVVSLARPSGKKKGSSELPVVNVF